MRILVFGTGDYYERYKKWLRNDDIVALLDNNKGKQGQIIDGNHVLSPEDAVRKLDFDAVFILSAHVSEMTKQLLRLGVCGERISTNVSKLREAQICLEAVSA